MPINSRLIGRQRGNLSPMDAMIFNIDRACQAAIDSAMHVIASQKLGIPKNSGDAFTLLNRAGLLPKEISERLKAMTGFRNIAVHQYQNIDTDIFAISPRKGGRILSPSALISE